MTTTPGSGDFRFSHRLRVRWAEVDMQKIVFNAHYLMYLDTAVADYWRALGLPYEEAMRQLGGDLYVKKASLEYHGSARFDDRLDVALRCERIGTSSLTFRGAIFRGGQLLVGAELVYVFADPATQTSRPVPPALRAVITGYEAGGDVFSLRTGDMRALGAEASVVRTAVFVDEQGIAMDIERDAADAGALHAVACNGLGQPVGAGRLLPAQDGVAKVGRMAVHRVLRGGGLGARLLQVLVAAAQARGDREVVLYAQASAAGFYERFGFTVRGEPFEEAGIAHIAMAKALKHRAVERPSD